MSQDDPMRPLLQLPSWDGKLVFAAMLLVGYIALVLWTGGGHGEIPTTRMAIIHDAQLTMGPPIGAIIAALFRQTGADERREALRSSELRTAINAPTPALPPEPTPTGPEIGDAVERGAAAGAEAGIRSGLDDSGDGKPL